MSTQLSVVVGGQSDASSCERVSHYGTITMVRAILRKKIALYSIIIGACIKKKNKRSQRRVWCREWLQRRETMGSSVTILRELQEESETLFRNYLRMDINSFYTLVSKVEGYIQRQDTNMRQSISPAARVEATLRYLATGCCYTSLQYSTRISKQSLSIIIPETCDAIYEALKDDYMKVSYVEVMRFY